MIRLFTALLILLSYNSVYADSDCAECDKFKIVGVYDFLPPPAGNNVVLLLTVTEDLDSGFDPHYSDLFFVDSFGEPITNRFGMSNTLPTTPSDTIPYSMVLSTELRNQDFPTDFDGMLVIQTLTNGPCIDFKQCNISYSNVVTNVTESQSDLSLQVYPNPFTDYLNISTAKSVQQISIFDINSSKILEVESINNVDLSNLNTGYYLLKITYSDSTYDFKSILKY